METINYVDLHEADAVDTSLIAEISQGRNGVKIKLLDSQKALEWLGRYFLLNPMDKHRIEYDNKRIALEEQKANGNDDIEDMNDIRNEVFGNDKVENT